MRASWLTMSQPGSDAPGSTAGGQASPSHKL